jgi:hypothetical protein
MGLAAVILLVGVSCMGIKSELWLAADGSGQLAVEYRIPQIIIESCKNHDRIGGGVTEYNGVEIPTGFSRQRLEKSLKEAGDFTLKEYNVRKQGAEVYIRCLAVFSDSKNLERLEVVPKITVENEDGKTKVSQAIYFPTGLEDSEEKIKVREVYKDYKMIFIIHAPKAIVSHKLGELGSDKRTLTLEYSLLDPKIGQKPIQADDSLEANW